MVLGDIDVQSAGQTWHLWRWAASGGALGSFGAAVAAADCVAGVALGDINFHFGWQPWPLCICGYRTLCGRRGTYGAGLAPVARVWCPGRRGTLRGRRGTW